MRRDEVFVYTGPRGEGVPVDVVRVRVDPSVTSIPARAFDRRKKLAEVELCEGLVEIGYNSFAYCDHSITKIITPTSLKRIRMFSYTVSLPSFPLAMVAYVAPHRYRADAICK
jgi:hypothetical protein